MTNPETMHVCSNICNCLIPQKWGNLVIFHDPCSEHRALTKGGGGLLGLQQLTFSSEVTTLHRPFRSQRLWPTWLLFPSGEARGRGRGGPVRPVADVPRMFPNHGPTIGNKNNKDKEDQNIRKLKQSQGKILRTSVVTK